MSEYQYYEFCKISSPLTQAARKEALSLSSCAKVSTHGASYVYHYGDFRGDPKMLLLKHFDFFFYIANWGSIQLMMKFPKEKVDVKEIKKYCIQGVISCSTHQKNIVLDIQLHDEEGFCGWIEGEGMLPMLLPLYDEIKSANYDILRLSGFIHDQFYGEDTETKINLKKLTKAQQTLLNLAQID